MHGFVSYRRFGRARSLRSDRAGRTLRSDRARLTLRRDRARRTLGRYIATEVGLSATLRPSGMDARSLCSDRAWVDVGCYVATERDVCSVATWRPSLARAQSLRSDRATFFGLFSDISCFFRKALRKNNFFPKIYFS